MFRLVLLVLAASMRLMPQTNPAKMPKPDLHGGGAKPSMITNGQQTLVTVPGFHFLHATVEAWGVCRLVEYKINTDTELQMLLEGRRTLDDKDDACHFRVRNAAGAATSWIVVGLTAEQEAERRAREEAAGRAKIAAVNQAAGKKWILHFANGAEDTYLAQGSNPDGMPVFKRSDDQTVKIFVRPDGSVTMIEEGCMRTGRMSGNKVEKGESAGDCRPAGSWSATVER